MREHILYLEHYEIYETKENVLQCPNFWSLLRCGDDSVDVFEATQVDVFLNMLTQAADKSAFTVCTRKFCFL
jgi:hypothetical protein